MNISILLRTSALGVAILAAPCAWAADSASQTFLTNAIQGNLAEISVGQLAEKNGGTDAVKALGRELVTDHTKANQDAMSVAQGMNMTPPTAPNAEQMAMHDKLASQTGAGFDGDFLSGMLKDHKKDVADYKTASSMNDAVGQYAGRTLPALEQHMADIQKVADAQGGADAQGSMGKPAMAGDGPMLVSGANSFTEGEAKGHIEKAGYTAVSALKKDDQGIWRGTATKNGATVPVGLDFKGNVSSR